MKDWSFNKAEFDEYADNYDTALAHGLSVSGEDKDYFAKGRTAWLAKRLRALAEQFQSIMDLGCGIGSTSPLLLSLTGAESVLGIDTSANSVEAAKKTYGSKRTHFLRLSQYVSKEEIDLVYCSGVFHHIPPHERLATVDYVYRSLRPGGLFAIWENNPWNPGPRYVMSRIPFDRDACNAHASRNAMHAASRMLQNSTDRFSIHLPQDAILVAGHRTICLAAAVGRPVPSSRSEGITLTAHLWSSSLHC